ncbi:uncharacterized protein LOC110860034 isoform X2 [Folsomia candida]|uniref:uncharacterized protein LOC110860034 isoform X2 n=1 Tax=Folsomia candida TaxID=158441 RepID=UPI000B8F86DC|nr:uncharacterized protein LOC110860034 isoform X2 [Folsomia candida]
MSSKKQKSSVSTFTQLIESEKTNYSSSSSSMMANNNHSGGEEDEEEEELLFEEDLNKSPEPQPDLSVLHDFNINNVKEVKEVKQEQQQQSVQHVKEGSNTTSISTHQQITQQKTVIKTQSSTESSSKEKKKMVVQKQVTQQQVVQSEQVVMKQQQEEEEHHEEQQQVVQENDAVGNKLQRKKEINQANLFPINNPTGFPLGESKVFAKVCVAELRRSFGSLICERNNNQSDFSSLDWNSRSKSSDPASDDQLQRSSKSSFSKFDKLQKRTLKEQEANGSNQKICKSCSKEVFLVELIKAEKSSWHKNCFRCVECQKQLSVDTYSSHEGKLYCKPHHRSLFLPKQVIRSSEEEMEPVTKPKPTCIIRENDPVQLPPDVVRASDSLGTGLEDLQIDVKSRFEMFEKKKSDDADLGGADKIQGPPVKRSPSVLAKLAKYEKSASSTNGVLTEELVGNGVELNGEESEEEEQERIKIKSPLTAMQEIMQQKQLEEVRNKWKSNDQGDSIEARTQEQMAEERKSEMARFRSRLCQGKSTNLKTLYEQGLTKNESTGSESTNVSELESLNCHANNRKLKELFEKGEIYREDENDDGNKNKLDMDVFEAGVGKEGRKLWQQLDKQQMMEPVKPVTTRGPTRFITTLPTANQEIIRSDSTQDEIKIETESLREKFKFFEQQKEQQQQQGKVFRITPEREGENPGGKISPTRYVDPTVTTPTTDPMEQCILTKSKTASKMLSVFRELESQQDKPVAKGERKFKEFTPPRGDTIKDNCDSGRSDDENDNDEECEDGEEGGVVDTEKDAFLKEVGSLAKARSLRARFEKWEQCENERNKKSHLETAPIALESGEDADGQNQSIESASILRAKFEEKMRQEQEIKASKAKVVVRRFVSDYDPDSSPDYIDSAAPSIFSSLIISTTPSPTSYNNTMADSNCAFCEKKVYAMEKLEANSQVYHKTCFRCSVCKTIMRLDAFTFHHGALYCKNHFKQLFKIKGNYDEGFGFETQKQLFAKKQAEQK